jgi:hypothetical protein
MPAEQIFVQPDIQPNVQSPIIPPAEPAPVRKTHYSVFIVAFIFLVALEAIISYFLFIKIPADKAALISAAPTLAPAPSPTPTPVLCSDPPCLVPQFLACNASKLTMPFMEGSSFIVTVYGKENDLCRYSLTVADTKTNAPLNSSECRMPMEKMTKDTFGHLFGEDKNPGKEAIKAEQDTLESQYCVSKTLASTPSPIQSPSPTASPTPKKVTCGSNDQMCIFTNIIDNFTGGCKPIAVTTTVDGGAQVTLTVSPGANNACGFSMKGPGMDQSCLFAKENVTTTVIKGMMGMDNIPKDPEFIKIKAASCK